MNSELFWIAKRKLSQIKFVFNKTLFYIGRRLYRIRATSSFSFLLGKTLLSQITLNLIIASILYAGDTILNLMIDNITTVDNITFDSNALMNIIVGGMGVAGVILGLYCTNMASIYSAKYTNAPNSISEKFQTDIITNKCVKQIVGYIILCLILLFECIIGINLDFVSIIALFILTIRMIVTFSITGNRTYQLSDTYRIADNIYPEIYSLLHKISNQRYFSKDKNFQNHFQIVCTKQLKFLEDIAVYNKDNPQNQNAAMISFMTKNLRLINSYWSIKSSIYYDSYWFRSKEQYQQWHYASDHEIDIALRTGTTLNTTQVKDYLWFEKSVESINNVCFDKICKEVDLDSIYSYLTIVSNLSANVINGDNLAYWIGHVKSIREKVLLLCVKAYENNNKENNDAVAAIADILSAIYLNFIIGVNNHLRIVKPRDILEKAKRINSYKDVNYDTNKFLNNRICEKMFRCIEAEILIEKKRITPDWFIEQTVSQIILNHWNKIIETMILLYNDCFEFANDLMSKKLYFQAMIIYSRFPEFDSKSNIMIGFFEENIPILMEKHFEKSILWDECNLEALKNKRAEIAKRLPEYWVKCSGIFAIQNWETREDYPDLLGFCYNHLCEYLLSAIQNNDLEGFEAAYKDFLSTVLLYQEYVRTDAIKVKESYRQNAVFHVITAPIIEYAMISGLAILWGEFSENEQWRNTVDHELEKFINSDKENLERLIHISELAAARKDHLFGIGNRDVLQTGWEMCITRAIHQKGLYKFDYEKYGSKIMITNSKLLKAFCRSTFDFRGLSDSEDVYFVLCVNKYLPNDKKYRGRFKWEENLYEEEE